MSNAAENVLLIETAERVRTLTLNRPQRATRCPALRTQLFAALRAAETDDGVDVVILTGADPVFCAGLDLKELGDTTELPDISPSGRRCVNRSSGRSTGPRSPAGWRSRCTAMC